MKREPELITEGNPCWINYFDDTLLTVQQARERGMEYCPKFPECKGKEVYCALGTGKQVAECVIKKGIGLREELGDYIRLALQNGWLDNKFWNSLDRKTFTEVSGKSEILKAIEGFARVVLIQDPFESVLPYCKKCEGVVLEKVVIDSIHDCPGIHLSGSGRTKTRLVSYCPNCDPEPKDGIINVDPLEEIRKDIEEAKGLGRSFKQE